jgi:hypothetical protein
MKIIRKGNKKGLDVDYQVNVETPEDVEKLHQQLLNKGLLFTYATGDIPYQKFDSNVVLHYIDKSFNVYDYAIIFTPQAKKDKQTKTLEEEYQRSKTDPEYKTYFMKYMKHHKTITAFKKHMKFQVVADIGGCFCATSSKVCHECDVRHTVDGGICYISESNVKQRA